MRPGDHPFWLDLRGRVLRAQLHAAENAAVPTALADMPAAERNAAEIRLVAAALELAEGHAEIAFEELGPVIENAAPAAYAGPTAMEALLLDVAAHEELGDARAVEASLERALELRVVRHLPSNLKATEIASELCVSPNTVRTHLRHIYAKLDAHTRSEAVTRTPPVGAARARRPLGTMTPA